MSPADLERSLDQLLDRHRPIAKSLIVSLFGDAILPHGGSIWLGSLAGLMEPFQLNDRVVRTSVFRLSKEGWLGSTQIGRRSVYSLTDTGRRRFEAADRIIYSPGPKPWDERWTVVLLTMLSGEPRDHLRNDLAWQGFGQCGADVMLHPAPDEASLRQSLAALPAGQTATVMTASTDQWLQADDLRRLVAQAWDIEKLRLAYSGFLDDFRPFLAADPISPLAAFRLRTLLIHAWRRVVLRDPLLPDELLPVNWPGASARLLCRNIYRAVQAPAEAYLADHMETADGPPGMANSSFFQRFGGLEEPALQVESRA